MSNSTEVTVPVTFLEEELWEGNDLKLSHEAIDWLKYNVVSWRVAFMIQDDGVSTELSFIFQSEEDAIAFKLRWL